MFGSRVGIQSAMHAHLAYGCTFRKALLSRYVLVAEAAFKGGKENVHDLVRSKSQNAPGQQMFALHVRILCGSTNLSSFLVWARLQSSPIENNVCFSQSLRLARTANRDRVQIPNSSIKNECASCRNTILKSIP